MKMSYDGPNTTQGSNLNLNASIRNASIESGANSGTNQQNQLVQERYESSTNKQTRDYTWLELKPARDLQELTNTIEGSSSQLASKANQNLIAYSSCASTSSPPLGTNQNCPCHSHQGADCNPVVGQPNRLAPSCLQSAHKTAIQLARQAILNKHSLARGIKRASELQHSSLKVLSQPEPEPTIEISTQQQLEQQQQQSSVDKESLQSEPSEGLQVPLSCGNQSKITENRKVQISSRATTNLGPQSGQEEQVSSEKEIGFQEEQGKQAEEEDSTEDEEESDFNYEPVLSQILNEKKLALSASPEVIRFLSKLQQKIPKQRQSNNHNNN